MKRLHVFLAGLTVLAFAFAQMASAATNYYVATNGPGGGFTNWATAASSIQDAIDRTIAGDTVWVSNGVYNTGGTTYRGSSTSRVVISRAITVRSANNDPANTIIVGAKDPSTGSNGPAAVRGVLIAAAGSSLIGFTVTNGATQNNKVLASGCGGGVNGNMVAVKGGATVSNCIITGCSANYVGGGAFDVTLNNCTIAYNSAAGNGGGIYNHAGYTTRVNNCTLIGNWAPWGGGVRGAVMNNCQIISNSAGLWGGGTYEGILNNCMLIGNSAGLSGGGTYACNLNNCQIISNSAPSCGGTAGGIVSNCTIIANSGNGVGGGTLYNCLIAGNSDPDNYGGGALNATLYNCTITGNTALSPAGGVASCTMHNCIIYFNEHGNYYPNCSFTNCCSPGLSGSGNVTNDPMFVSTNTGNYRLSPNSHCINAGTNQNWMLSAVDLDGHHRINPDYGNIVDIGAYEYVPAMTKHVVK